MCCYIQVLIGELLQETEGMCEYAIYVLGNIIMVYMLTVWLPVDGLIHQGRHTYLVCECWVKDTT